LYSHAEAQSDLYMNPLDNYPGIVCIDMLRDP
jgi:hypothetical protein